MAPEKQIKYPELVFGLVGAVGTDFDPVVNALRNSLGDVGYSHCEVIGLSRLLDQFDIWDGKSPAAGLPEDERIDSYMTAGNKLRELTKRGDALVGAAVEGDTETYFRQQQVTEQESNAQIIADKRLSQPKEKNGSKSEPLALRNSTMKPGS